MKQYWFFLPVAGLVIFAGVLGLRLGAQPTETEIINRYAAAYLATAPAGALATDCAAKPHADPAIRMVVICSHHSGIITTYFVGKRGASMPEPEGPSA